MTSEPKPACVTDTAHMIGTLAWCGTWNGLPALLLSYWVGATLWAFVDGHWVKGNSFDSTADAWKKLDLEEGG